jgi:hypothetical protein
MWFFDLLLIVGGYTLSIFTWPWLRTQITGIEVEYARAVDLVKSLKAKL